MNIKWEFSESDLSKATRKLVFYIPCETVQALFYSHPHLTKTKLTWITTASAKHIPPPTNKLPS